jgi:hypothetical protein
MTDDHPALDELQGQLKKLEALAAPILRYDQIARADLNITNYYDGHAKQSDSWMRPLVDNAKSDRTGNDAVARASWREEVRAAVKHVSWLNEFFRHVEHNAGPVDLCLSCLRLKKHTLANKTKTLCAWCYEHRGTDAMPHLEAVREHLAGRNVKRPDRSKRERPFSDA